MKRRLLALFLSMSMLSVASMGVNAAEPELQLTDEIAAQQEILIPDETDLLSIIEDGSVEEVPGDASLDEASEIEILEEAPAEDLVEIEVEDDVDSDIIEQQEDTPSVQEQPGEEIVLVTEDDLDAGLEAPSYATKFGGIIIPSSLSFKYTGSVQKPTFQILTTSGSKVSTSNYDIVYSNKNSKAVGSYTVKIYFTNKYTGTYKFTYKITGSASGSAKINNVVRYKDALEIDIKTVVGAAGYQVRYSKSSSMSSAKIVSAPGQRIPITGLSKGTNYYVQARYYTISGSTISFGSWSSTKSVETRGDSKDVAIYAMADQSAKTIYIRVYGGEREWMIQVKGPKDFKEKIYVPSSYPMGIIDLSAEFGDLKSGDYEIKVFERDGSDWEDKEAAKKEIEL